MDTSGFQQTVSATCPSVVAQVWIFHSAVLSFVLMLASFAYSSMSASQHLQSVLPLSAAACCFVASLTNWLGWVVADPTANSAVGCVSWMADCYARLSLFVFSFTRVRRLAASSHLINAYFFFGCLYILALNLVIVIDAAQSGSGGILLDDYSTIRRTVLALYFASDLMIVPMDLYLAYMVVFVAKSKGTSSTVKGFNYYFTLMRGAGYAMALSVLCSILVTILRLTGHDDFYVYYQVVYSFRICVIQIFNMRIIEIMAIKRQKNSHSVENAVKKLINWKKRTTVESVQKRKATGSTPSKQQVVVPPHSPQVITSVEMDTEIIARPNVAFQSPQRINLDELATEIISKPIGASEPNQMTSLDELETEITEIIARPTQLNIAGTPFLELNAGTPVTNGILGLYGWKLGGKSPHIGNVPSDCKSRTCSRTKAGDQGVIFSGDKEAIQSKIEQINNRDCDLDDTPTQIIA